MDKKTFISTIEAELEKLNISNRKNFVKKSFVNPEDEVDGEMTINGAQIFVVVSDHTGLKYDFYKINEDLLQDHGRENIIKSLKDQYNGIIFYLCGDGSDGTSKTIDITHNLIVAHNDDFSAAVELCGDINQFVEMMLQSE